MSNSTMRSRAPDLISDLAEILAAGVIRFLVRQELPCESGESKRSCVQSVDGERGQESEIMIGGDR